MALDEPSASEFDLSRALAALYPRIATALERSAGLAEQHAARVSSKGQDELAAVELERAGRARAAARRSRELAERTH
jgi:hypothetical protein